MVRSRPAPSRPGIPRHDRGGGKPGHRHDPGGEAGASRHRGSREGPPVRGARGGLLVCGCVGLAGYACVVGFAPPPGFTMVLFKGAPRRPVSRQGQGHWGGTRVCQTPLECDGSSAQEHQGTCHAPQPLGPLPAGRLRHTCQMPPGPPPEADRRCHLTNRRVKEGPQASTTSAGPQPHTNKSRRRATAVLRPAHLSTMLPPPHRSTTAHPGTRQRDHSPNGPATTISCV